MSAIDTRLALAILGVGHFGRFHALKAAANPRVRLVGLADADAARAATVAAEAGTVALAPEAAIAGADAVIIAAPTRFHHGLAMAALAAGRHVFIEKPIAATLEEADALIAAAQGRVLQVGHIERFSAAFRAVVEAPAGGRALSWDAVRAAPFRPRSLDVSVVLDLMIHDIDLVLALAGEEPSGIEAVGAAVASDLPDFAVARLRFAGGRAAVITASRVSLAMERRLRVLGTEGEMSVNFLDRSLAVLRRGGAEAVATMPGHGIDRATWTDHDSLEAEQAAFVAACLDGAPVVVDGAAGRRALKVALAVEAAISGGMMTNPRIAIVGAGAVGGYAGAYMAQAGHDVTFIDPWPEHVEAMRTRGLTIAHLKDVPEFTVPVRAIHLTELQSFAKERPVDIAFICMKSYDTAWATTMIAQYLAPGGYVVSLQNCINEEVIAGVVGWGRVLGAIASLITVELSAPGLVKRAAGKSGASHTVYRVGEPHGRVSPRAEFITSLVALSDSALTTTNLWGERWSKLVANVMGNGIAAATGLLAKDATADDAIRAFAARLGSEAIRVGQALGYDLEEILHLDPEIIARAGEGDDAARAAYDAQRLADTQKPGGGAHRASMGQDMMKGRRTEIEFLNGFVVARGAEIGIAAPANAALTGIVKRVERGEIAASPDLIRGLRLN